MRRIMVIALVAITAVSLAATEPAHASTGTDELDFAAKLNELRVSRGLRPLEYGGALFDQSRAWSAQMLAAGGISHDPNLRYTPLAWTKLGENVGMGYDVQGLHDAFVNSPAHFQNMIDPAFDAMGVGVVRAADGKIFVTVRFMQSKAQPTTKRVCTKNRRGRTTCRTMRVG
ncbi:MAG: CAP domain-containing protein [Acidimicrobiales bacterium]